MYLVKSKSKVAIIIGNKQDKLTGPVALAIGLF